MNSTETQGTNNLYQDLRIIAQFGLKKWIGQRRSPRKEINGSDITLIDSPGPKGIFSQTPFFLARRESNFVQFGHAKFVVLVSSDHATKDILVIRFGC